MNQEPQTEAKAISSVIGPLGVIAVVCVAASPAAAIILSFVNVYLWSKTGKQTSGWATTGFYLSVAISVGVIGLIIYSITIK